MTFNELLWLVFAERKKKSMMGSSRVSQWFIDVLYGVLSGFRILSIGTVHALPQKSIFHHAMNKYRLLEYDWNPKNHSPHIYAFSRRNFINGCFKILSKLRLFISYKHASVRSTVSCLNDFPRHSPFKSSLGYLRVSCLLITFWNLHMFHAMSQDFMDRIWLIILNRYASVHTTSAWPS